MPTYEYMCKSCGHLFEIVQSMRDDPLTECPECAGELRKVFAPPAISFKGSGFYATDHGKKKSTPAGESGDKGKKKADDSGSSSSDTKSDTKKDSTSTDGASSKPKEPSSSSTTTSSGSASGKEGSGGS
jgi:putative FmdB family regulatory protein